jgi:hypothetical protein
VSPVPDGPDGLILLDEPGHGPASTAAAHRPETEPPPPVRLRAADEEILFIE